MTAKRDIAVDAPASDPHFNRRRLAIVAASAAFVMVAVAVALSRNRGVPFIDIVYAEDGTRFYGGALNDDLSIIVEPYAGYMHLVPRLAGEVVAILPTSWVGAGSSLFAAISVGLLALYVFFASRVLLESWVSRSLLAAAIVMLPVAGQTIGNFANLHWYLMFAAFWALIGDPDNRWWAGAAAVIGVAAALSDPLTALLLPSAALAAFRYRSRLHGAVVVAVLGGLALQAFVVLGAEQRPGEAASVFDLPAVYAFRVAGGLSIGDVHLVSAWQRAGWSVPVTAIAVIAAAIVLAIAWSSGWRRIIVATSVVNSMLFFAVALMVRGTTMFLPVVGEPAPIFAGRYVLLPALFLVVSVAVLLDLAVVERSPKQVLVGGIAAGWLVLSMVANSAITPLPDGPSWSTAIESARQECRDSPTGAVKVPIAPPGWGITLSCADV